MNKFNSENLASQNLLCITVVSSLTFLTARRYSRAQLKIYSLICTAVYDNRLT